MNPLVIPCPNRVTCPATDSPFANLTSEAADSEIFIGQNFGSAQLQPPLGWSYTNPRGFGFCGSTVSQAAADSCAQNTGVIDKTDDPPDGDGGHWRDPFGHPLPVYTNTPQQCAAICPDGLPFIYQVAAGLFTDVSQAGANAAAQSFACTLAMVNKVCLGNFTQPACIGAEYDSIIDISGHGPFTVTVVSGSLPPGLSLNPLSTISQANALELQGIPTASGSFQFALQATNTAGNSITKLFNFNVLGINPTILPDASQGVAYTQQLTGAGGVLPFSFDIVEDTLPDGLTMDATGLISGTPTTTGDSQFTVRVTDSTGAFCDVRYDLMVKASGPDWASADWQTDGGTQLGNLSINGIAIMDGTPVDLGDTASLDFVYDTTGSFFNVTAFTSLPYSGGSANCKLVIRLVNNQPPGGEGLIRIAMDLDGTGINPFNPTLDFRNNNAGTYEFDFTIPGSGTINVSVQSIYSNPQPPGEYILTFSNT